jgi:predicted nucleic acid-binding protein
VYYDFARSSDRETAQRALEDLGRVGLTERNDLDPEFWRIMGQLKATHRRVSLADCAALALAKRVGACLVTADRHEFEALETLSVCEFVFIR